MLSNELEKISDSMESEAKISEEEQIQIISIPKKIRFKLRKSQEKLQQLR